MPTVQLASSDAPTAPPAEPPQYPSQRSLRRWDGGLVRLARGREVFVIEKWAGGRRYKIALGVRTEREALAELALFDRDPLAYRTRKQQNQEQARAPAGLRLDAATLAEFSSDARAKVEQGELSEGYVRHTLQPYLKAWAEALGGKELCKVTLGDLNAILGNWRRARHKRIVALRAFTAWARKTGKLERKDDPTLDLPVPQPRAEKSVRAKGYAIADVEHTYAALTSQALRDVIRLRATTGMHDTEIARVADGDAEIREVNDPCGIAGTITFRHLKAGKIHVVSLDAAGLAAARRLAARGSPLTRAPALLMLKRAHRRLAGDACTCGADFAKADECTARPPIIRPSELRHSFATWARGMGKLVRPSDGGVPLDEVAAVMGHTSARTTKVFYEGNEVPPMIALPLCLAHMDDPKFPARTRGDK